MNLKFNNKQGQTETKETDLLDDSDCSDLWELPEDWLELQHARLERDKKIARLRRLRRREERQKLIEAEKKFANQINSERIQSDDSFHGSLLVTKSEDNGLETEDDVPGDTFKRGQWNNSCEFLLSLIAMSVGMGNFYRFPFVAYQNGGGAFLIPYFLVLTFIGKPMYFLELAIGQFYSYGQVKVWDMSPIFRGVGYGAAIASFVVVTYYTAIMGIAFHYFFQTFRETLPWSNCNPEWATKKVCEDLQKNMTRTGLSAAHFINLPEIYYYNSVLEESDNIDDGIGYPLLVPTGCLFVTWLLIYGMIAGGVESSGKAAYITTIYPFTIIFIILVIVSTKEGAGTGMLFFLKPQWGKMLDPTVWFAAVGQCFFSLGIGFGPIINYSSFNNFRHNVFKDAMVVSFMDTLSSFIAGLTVFGTIGSVAHDLNKPMDENVVEPSTGLLFITFADAITNFDYFPYAPQVLSLLFFTMLLTLAAGTAVSSQLAVVTVVCDNFPKARRFWVTTSLCVIGFVASLIYVTPGGQFMVTLVDYYGGSIGVYIFTTLECIGVAWVYGIRNFVNDLEFMMGKKVNCVLKLCWAFIIPVVLTSVLTYYFVIFEPLKHRGKPFPNVAHVLGWMLTAFTLLVVPVVAGLTLYNLKGSCKQRILQAIRPTEDFGPRNPTDRERWKLFKQGVLVTGGPGPDTYKLPAGQTQWNNNLPEWLTVLEDGTVVPRKYVEQREKTDSRKEINSNTASIEDLE